MAIGQIITPQWAVYISECQHIARAVDFDIDLGNRRDVVCELVSKGYDQDHIIERLDDIITEARRVRRVDIALSSALFLVCLVAVFATYIAFFSDLASAA